MQERIVQFFEQFLSCDQHLSHLFFSWRKPRQIAQFIPQGAMSFVFMRIVVVMNLSFVGYIVKN